MDIADISLIGSGVAGTVTLIEVLDTLLNNPPPSKKLRVAVIEKYHEFWKGIPYGNRSSINALTITSIHEFIHEPERHLFFEWLKSSKNDWISYYREHGGIIADNWLKNNLPFIKNEEWENIYVPRFLFGNYLSQKFTSLLKTAEEKQLVEFKLVQAEAIDINVMAGGLHEIILEHPDNILSKIITRKLVVATGSPPVKKICEISDNKTMYVNDIYEPSLSENLNKLHTHLNKRSEAGERNILIIGSNASCIELLYLMQGMPEFTVLINKMVVISTSGSLPYYTSTEILPDHPTPNLDKLKASGDYNIEKLVEGAALDIALAIQNGANMDYVATIIFQTLTLLEVLDEDAKKLFFAIYAIHLHNMFRRAGPEYRNAAQFLIDFQRVIIVRGAFLNICSSEKGSFLNYLDMETSQQRTYPLDFKAIINCSGSADLESSSSRLLFNLVNKNICRMNLSRKGFEVNEKFEAAPNIYIMGPLLGGNVNKLIHFWQLENAARLTYLAPYLTEELLNI
ncbi:MAG TPA: FAD/NAD(P)-binding protein [Puia sp.]|jgi:uncharacterized NAD(P)/FAD-binding protein YdhS|nr:FAD/NAD(P)-binding protein [Puia sp.]